MYDANNSELLINFLFIEVKYACTRIPLIKLSKSKFSTYFINS